MSDRGRPNTPSAPGGRGPQSRPSQSPTGARPASPGPRGSGGAPRAPGAPAGWKSGMGFDPAKPAKKEERGNTRVELPPDAYCTEANKDIFTLRGKKFNTQGKPEIVDVNQLRMIKFDFSKKIFQYDIAISPDTEKRGPVLKKIWNHPTFKVALAKYNYAMWLFDGRKLAWSSELVDRGELRFTVDLDEGQRTATGREDNKFFVTIRKTTEIHVSTLQGYLDRKIQFGNNVQEALNFLDHLVRQWPSQNLLAIKRNFYNTQDQAYSLMGGRVVEVYKGAYTSVRLSHNLARGGVGLALNVDVANTCFWSGGQTMEVLAVNFLATCERRFAGQTPATLNKLLRPVKSANGQWQSSDAFKQLRKMRKLKFTVAHHNRPASTKLYTAVDFAFDQRYGPEGGSARNVTFDFNGRQISIVDYYKQKYKVTLKYADLPVIYAGKMGHVPMEFAFVEPMQRYNFKLNPEQTAAMIKFAVTRPPVRRADIQKKITDLQIGADPYLKHYGVQFEAAFTKTEARILAPPVVNFAQGTADPKFTGRWDLRGKKFWKSNAAPLQSWGFIALENCATFPQLQQFSVSFKKAFLGHGGKCTADALLLNVPANLKTNVADALAWAHGEVSKVRGYTQLIFVVVPQRNSPYYERLKKSADCRFGFLTQVVHAAAVSKNDGQYHSNVCMKVNCKMGGATSRTAPPWKATGPTYFPKDRPTMIVGVDISHGAPGGGSPSTAAMTMSVDRDATRFSAMVESNGYREEMLTPANVHFLFGQLARQWMSNHDKQFPKHIMYFRDGVAEGQFAQVLAKEVAEMRNCLKQELHMTEMPKFTVIIATKRHHIRFFPQKGDKNGNALPGTLVEKEVTHPFMWDFYLCSHVAIQGTARPVHYHVLVDEMNIPANDLQKMIYHQCYSYARSTTPVSLHPAVYYAHLAGARARSHENIATSEGFRHGAKGLEMIRDREAKGKAMVSASEDRVAPKLLALGGAPNAQTGPVEGEMRQRNFFRSTMWFI